MTFDIAAIMPFAATCGIETVEQSPEVVALRLPLATKVQNHLGTVHAGAIYTLAEIAAGLVLALNFDLANVWFVNKDATVRYRKPARSDLVCRATLPPDKLAAVRAEFEAAGRADFRHGAEVVDADGVTVAEFEATFVLRPMRK